MTHRDRERHAARRAGSAMLLGIVAGLAFSGCGSSASPLPPTAPSLGPATIGIDWGRSNPVERPAEAFDVPSDRPFSTGLGNSGHQLNFPGQAIMADVAAAAGGFVAIGYVYPGWRPIAWTSPDAMTWSVQRMEPTDFTFPTALAVGADRGLVAVGRSGQAARAWTSADGQAWQLRDVAPHGDAGLAERMLTVIATPGGFLAGGSAGPENSGREARFWTSADGATWTPIPDDPATFANAEVRSIVAVDGGYVALGWVGPAREVSGSVAWISVDGLRWTRLDQASLVGARVAAATVAPFGGLVAVGSDLADDEALVWTSAEGRTWTRAPSEPSRKHDWKTRMTDVTSVGKQLIAVGNYLGYQYGTATSWVSTDGLHWEQARSAPVQEQGEMYAIVPGGPGVVAVGSFGAPDNYVPMVWLSPAR